MYSHLIHILYISIVQPPTPLPTTTFIAPVVVYGGPMPWSMQRGWGWKTGSTKVILVWYRWAGNIYVGQLSVCPQNGKWNPTASVFGYWVQNLMVGSNCSSAFAICNMLYFMEYVIYIPPQKNLQKVSRRINPKHWYFWFPAISVCHLPGWRLHTAFLVPRLKEIGKIVCRTSLFVKHCIFKKFGREYVYANGKRLNKKGRNISWLNIQLFCGEPSGNCRVC